MDINSTKATTVAAGQSGTQPPEITALEATCRQFDVSTSAGRVRWKHFGQGKPLVLLHGGHGSWMHWAPNISALAEQRSVWVPDLPGFGESADVQDDGSLTGPLTVLVDGLAESLDRILGSNTAIDLVGFSFGALASAHLANRRGNIRSIALLGPAGHGEVRRPEVDMPAWKHAILHERELLLRRNVLSFMLYQEKSVDTLALYIHEISSLRSRFRSRPVSRASRMADVLQNVTTPILFVWGEHDSTAIPEIVGPILTANLPQRCWVTLPDAAHWVQYECATKVNHLLIDWLDKAG